MRRCTMRIAALSSVSVLALAVGAPAPASAQDGKPGFYLGLQGAALWSGGTDLDLPFSSLSSGLGDVKVPPGGEPGGNAQVTLGYQFPGPWSLELNGSGTWLPTTSDSTSTVIGPVGPIERRGTVNLDSRADYYLADFDAGYAIKLGDRTDVKLSAGVQYGNFHVKRGVGFATGYYYAGGGRVPGAPQIGISAVSLDSKFWGVGPKLGIDGKYRLGRSGFSVIGGVSGSVLFGRLTNSTSTYYSYSSSESKGHTAYGLNADLGLAYQLPYVAVDSSITLGFKVDQWWSIAQQPDIFTSEMKNVDVLDYGPFVNWTTHF
jgi:Legionella pneumophila major outer membrane protein precursor